VVIHKNVRRATRTNNHLRSAGPANTLGGTRANAMDAGVHDPQIRRGELGIYRSLRQAR